MNVKIGETAGKIWNLLKEKGEVNISQLPRLLNEKSVIVHQALGWLAREDKIEYRIEAGKTYIFLTEKERAR
jgi:Mn-dependent DtxR family transcriptional regulator